MAEGRWLWRDLGGVTVRIKEKDGRGLRPVCGLVLWLCVFVVILSIEFGHWENSTGPKEKSHGQEPPQDQGEL